MNSAAEKQNGQTTPCDCNYHKIWFMVCCKSQLPLMAILKVQMMC